MALLHRGIFVQCFFVGLVILPISTGLELDVSPAGFNLITENTNLTLSLALKSNDSIIVDSSSTSECDFIVLAVPDEDWKLDFVNRSVLFTQDDILSERNHSIILSGYYWGRTQLSFHLFLNQSNPNCQFGGQYINGSVLRDDVSIGVNRGFSLLDNIFMIVATIFILTITVNMGAQLNLHVIRQCLKRPLGPVCGFISQFGFMPPFSYLIGYLLFTEPLFRLGLFTLGCSPGGSMSNFFTLVFDGDINLSITMTFVSTIAAMGMMPLWMYTLGRRIIGEDESLQIPFSNLAISLVALTVPLLIGLLIQYKRPTWAEKMNKVVKPITLTFLLIFLTVGVYNSWKIFLIMTPEMFLAGALVACSGYIFGASFAKIFCLKKDQIIAISIETAMQNAGASYLVLKLSLRSPDADVASLPLMAQAMLTGMSLQTFYWSSRAIKLCFCQSKESNKEKKEYVKEEYVKEDADARRALMDNEDTSKVKIEMMAKQNGGHLKPVHPNGTDNHPNGTDNHPNGTDNHPNGTDNHPNGTGNHPNGTDNHPNGTNNHPNGTDNHPNGTDNHKTLEEDGVNVPIKQDNVQRVQGQLQQNYELNSILNDRQTPQNRMLQVGLKIDTQSQQSDEPNGIQYGSHNGLMNLEGLSKRNGSGGLQTNIV